MDEVVLLSEDGTPIGTAPKAQVHSGDTPLHLAFSCYVYDVSGRLLVSRRALTKRTWPGVWTNSFCGHPQPGEQLEDAVRRHGRLELGVELEGLHAELPDFRYLAVDASGVVENEVCPVFSAVTSSLVVPHPDEVMEAVWVEPARLSTAVHLTPWAFSPWLALQIDQLHDFTKGNPA